MIQGFLVCFKMVKPTGESEEFEIYRFITNDC